MKKLLSLFVLIFALNFQMDAQRIAIIDVNALLEANDDYINAQKEIDKVSAEWRQEIAQEYDQIKSLYNKYQAEQVLLSDEVKTQRENEIMEKEKQVRELQKQKFGPEGDLFEKRKELVNPIQDNVFAAIESYATDKGYDLIFDKSSAAGLLFASDEYDKTEEVKKRM